MRPKLRIFCENKPRNLLVYGILWREFDLDGVDFNILNLEEIPTTKSGWVYRVQEGVTLSEMMVYADEKGMGFNSFACDCLPGLCIHILPYQYSMVMEIKVERVLDTIQKIRDIIKDDYKLMITKQFQSPVKQFVKIPLSFRDLSPGSTSIYFELMTERFLEVSDE